MTDQEALDTAVARTGVERYRHLCSAANRLPPPNDPATWIRYMHSLAATSATGPRIVPLIRVDYGTTLTRPCGACP